MNDVQLQKTENGTYDWVFDGDDLVSASVYERTRNMVRHSLLLRRNESETILYKEKGSEIYAFVKDAYNSETELLLHDEVVMTCLGIDGIAFADVEISHSRDGGWGMKITVTRDDGIMVKI